MSDPEVNQPHVFLSYASTEREQAVGIADRLESAGVHIWVDHQAIAGGTSWGAEIAAGIEHCSAFLLLCSEAAFASRNVRQEIQLAWKYQRPYVPLFLQSVAVPRDVEYFLEGWQWVEVLDLPETEWLPRLLHALKRLSVQSDGVTDPAPVIQPAAARPALVSATNLPVPMSSLVGRRQEVEAVRRLLESNRLVTLTGPGGTGKTRLAVAVAAGLVDTYKDGIWLIELAPLADATLIPAAVAQTIGVKEQPDRPMAAALVAALKARHLLLILDNCEHLVSGAAALIDAIVAACPSVQVLATSQEVLRIPGEMVYRVAALTVPDEHDGRTPEAVQAYEAVQLFVERAAAVAPGFGLTAQNAAAIAEICRRLDGIPLAIELAAARARLLSPGQIAERLSDRFRLLAGGSRTALPRQQTLRGAIDWSYNLLDEPERAVLQRLSVFAGGWSLEAAEVVCADEPLAPHSPTPSPSGRGEEQTAPPIDTFEVLDLVAELADKSLIVVRGAEAELRYGMLGTIRQYAAERLVESGEASAIRVRHRDWYLALAERGSSEIQGPDQAVWLERLEMEHDNLRAAIDWSLGDDVEAGLRIAVALSRFWDIRSHAAEGWQRLERAVAAATEASAVLRANGLTHAGLLAQRSGELGRAVQWGSEAVALYRETSDSDGLSMALNNLALAERRLGNQDRAAALLDESLELRRSSGKRRSLAIALGNVGLAARDRGDYKQALDRYSQALDLFRSLTDKERVAWMLNNLAGVMVELREYERALSYCEEAFAISEALHDEHRLAWLLRIEGMVARGQGHLPLALTKLRESLDRFRALNDREGIAYCLRELAATATTCRKPAEAVRLLASETALRESAGFVLTPVLGDHREGYIAEARAALGEAAFNRAWADGRNMRVEDALAPILAEIVTT